jgi:hypothetical protein
MRITLTVAGEGSTFLARREEGEYLNGIKPTTNAAKGGEAQRDGQEISDTGH